MLIFTGGRKSLKHWLNISARSHICAFIHTEAFPLEQWSVAFGILGKKGTTADLEWHTAGPLPFSTEVMCHPSADRQDFASCKVICPQTHWYVQFKASGKQKPSPLLEHSTVMQLPKQDSALGLELICFRTREGHAPDVVNLSLEQGETLMSCLWKLLLLQCLHRCVLRQHRADPPQPTRSSARRSRHWALLVTHQGTSRNAAH